MIRDLLSLLSLLSQARPLNLWPALASRRPQKKALSIYLYRDGGSDRHTAALTIGTIATIALTTAGLSRQTARLRQGSMSSPARIFRSFCGCARALVRFGRLASLPEFLEAVGRPQAVAS
jgi:hypothetical protein